MKEVSQLTGISVRTLHYYDSIDLLKPTKVSDAGYRLYDNYSLNRLQTILIYRELQFSLMDIKKILDNPDFDFDDALKEQIHLLELQQKHTKELISLAHKIKNEGVNTMDFKVFDNEEFTNYASEVKEKWGHTPQYKEFQQINKKRNDEDRKEVNKEFMDIFTQLGALKHLPAKEEKVQDSIKALQMFITENYYNCTNEVLKGLGQMYVQDERFKKNIDKAGGEGTAEFVSQAIAVYCSK